MTPEQIADTVRLCRKTSGLSQEKLALIAGVGKTVVFDIEHGKPTIQLLTLLKVLDVLNIQIKLEPPIPIYGYP